jgi:hypothetical protein
MADLDYQEILDRLVSVALRAGDMIRTAHPSAQANATKLHRE